MLLRPSVCGLPTRTTVRYARYFRGCRRLVDGSDGEREGREAEPRRGPRRATPAGASHRHGTTTPRDRQRWIHSSVASDPHGVTSGPALIADEEGREARGRAGGGRLEREVGRQVVEPVGADRPDPADPQQGGRAVPVPDGTPRSQAASPRLERRSTTTERRRTPTTMSQGTAHPRSSSAVPPRRRHDEDHRSPDERPPTAAPRRRTTARARGTRRPPRASAAGRAARRAGRVVPSTEVAVVQQPRPPRAWRRPRRAPGRPSARCSRCPTPAAANGCRARRLVRLDTGSSSEPVFASHSVVMANGSGVERRPGPATASATGVSSTAVVSRLSTPWQTTARATKSNQSTATRPRPARAAWWPATSKTPARSQISAMTVIASRKTTIGPTRSTRGPATGRPPVTRGPRT